MADPFHTALLSAGLRFLDYALANGELWSLGGFVLGWLIQLAIAAFAYRLTQVRQFVRQYPWLYRRKRLAGLGGAALMYPTAPPRGGSGSQQRRLAKRTYGALAAAAIALAATPALAQIKIGSAGPMTSQYAAFGEQLKRGA